MAYLLCVSSCESSDPQTERKPGDTGDRNKVSLRCVFSCESSSVLTGRRTLYTSSMSKASCQCELFGGSSGYWTWRKTCHKSRRGRTVLQQGSVCVTLGWKTLKTTFHGHCSQKASSQNEHGYESSVYWEQGRSCDTLGTGGPCLSVV